MSTPPGWFRPVAVAALIWNLLGCAAYVADVMITPEQVSQMTEAEQALYAARPSWAVAATATAVWFGAAGCLGLVLRRKWSATLLVISLIGILAQDLWLFAMSGAASAAGPAAFVLQGLVLLIGIGLVLLARKASAQGWLG